MNKLIVLGAMLISLVVMDFLWIGLLMNRFYLNEFRTFGRISGGKFEPVLWAAGVVYLLMAAALFVFVHDPELFKLVPLRGVGGAGG